MSVYFAPKFTTDQDRAIKELAVSYADLYSRDDSAAMVANHVDMCFAASLNAYLHPEAPPDCLGKRELAPLAEAGIDLADMRRQEDVLGCLTHFACMLWQAEAISNAD